MSIKEKFAVLKFNSESIKPTKEVSIPEEWSRLLCLIEPVYPEMHQFFLWLAKQGVQLKNDSNSDKSIIIKGTAFESLPAITIEVNPEKHWPDGAMLQ